MTRSPELARLRNLGPRSAVGVHTGAKFRALAYRLLAPRGYRPSLNPIEGALRDEHWARLAPEVRERLRAGGAAPWDARARMEPD